MEILAFIYYVVTRIRNILYDRKILKIREIPNLEIFCVGNITVGGTGKTPAVQFFVKKLEKMGKKVAVVSRGYKGKRKNDPLLVSDGIKIFASPKESGDEPYIHALNLKSPII
ncbi:MAG: tetraacyldisaccharide 4'-kinase, partial [Fusobacteriaceae bacterium]